MRLGVLTGIASRQADGPRSWLWALRRVVLDSAILAATALAVLAVHALRVSNCRPVLGLAFFVLGPVIGGIMAGAWGALLGRLTARSRRATCLGVALLLASVVRHLVVFLTEPRIFFYDPFFGYWSGAIYDEVIRISGPYAWFRLSCAADLGVIAMAGLLVSARPAWTSLPTGRRRSYLVATVAALAVAGALQWNAGPLGWAPDRSTLLRELDGTYDTEHFTLHYPRSSERMHRLAPLVAEDCEFRYDQLEAYFGDPFQERIHVYLYRSSGQKRRLMGADRVYIAKPWLSETHLGPLPYGHRTLGHEIAHLFVAQYAHGPLRVASRWGVVPHMGLIEGLATATEGYRGRLTLHQWSAALLEIDKLPNMSRVMGPQGYWSSFGPTAYTTAGSLLLYLGDQAGVDALKRLYDGGDWQAATGRDLDAWVSDWKGFLADRTAVPLGEGELERARFRYDRKSVFARTCPLATAAAESEAAAARARGDSDAAISIRRQVLEWRGGDPAKRYALAIEFAVDGRFGEAEEQAVQVAEDLGAGFVLRSKAKELAVDMRWRLGDLDGARSGLAALQSEPLEWDDTRRIQAKRMALASSTPADVQGFLRDYLTTGPKPEPEAPDDESAHRDAELADGRDSAAADAWKPTGATRTLVEQHLAYPDSALVAYLLGIRIHSTGRPIEALVPLDWALSGAGDAETLPGPLRAEAWRRLGESWFFLGEFRRSADAFKRSAALVPPQAGGLIAELVDWQERAKWLEVRTEHSAIERERNWPSEAYAAWLPSIQAASGGTSPCAPCARTNAVMAEDEASRTFP